MSLNALLKGVLPHLPAIRADQEVETLQMLPAETLFLALKDSDAESALWVMENARTDQIQGIIDLDCWRGDNFLHERFFRYFEFMSYTTPEKLSEFMKDLDPEVITLALMETVDVLDFDPQNPPDIDENLLMISPDSRYVLVLKTRDPQRRERILQWMNKLSASDLELMRRHLESVKWEQRSDLEEFAYQLKKGRIEELGFVEREEAIKFFSLSTAPTLKKHLLEHPLEKRVKEESPLLDILGSDELLPQPISQAITDEGFFRKALSKIENPHLLELLRLELVRTVNAVFTAEDLLNEELSSLQVSASRSRAYLDLGLLYLSGGIEESAAEQLKVQPVFEITRLGWTLVQDLAKAAADLKNRFPLEHFDPLDRELIKGLDGRHPNIEHPDALRDLGLTDFKHFTLDSLHRCAERLGALAVLGTFFTQSLGASLLSDSEPYADNDSASARLATALFRQSSGREFSAKPLSDREWKELAPSWSEDKAQKLLAMISERVPDSARSLFMRKMMDRLEEITSLVMHGLDSAPKYSLALRWARVNSDR